MNVLAVIPARGGSKGIPGKNARLLHGKPLLYYSIENAKQCTAITDIVISTDDEIIASIARKCGTDVVMRNPVLADDVTPLDPVIFDAVNRMENDKNVTYDVVITLQPTSPTLKPETLKAALETFLINGPDTLISAVNEPHLAWSKNSDGYVPLYSERKNRQYLPPHYVETGAFLITRRECISLNSRLGNNIDIYELSQEESIDIDNKTDWILCDSILSKKRIVFRVDGYIAIGMGHIYHSLTLAYNLLEHDILFVTQREHTEGIAKIMENNIPVLLIDKEEDFYEYLKEHETDIVVNDCLDTSILHVQQLKALVRRVVTIEDLGPGAAFADATINALYENAKVDLPHVFVGEKFVCLRDEFIYSKEKSFCEKVNRISVLFGGTDPSNLTALVYRVAIDLHAEYPDVHFDFITGIGYACEEHGIVDNDTANIKVYRDCKSISSVLSQSDMALSSQGRTIYELAAMRVPSIVLAQNEREQTHTFASDGNGFENLGLGETVNPETLKNTIRWLIDTPQMRFTMRERMLCHSFRNNTKRVIQIILGDYCE